MDSFFSLGGGNTSKIKKERKFRSLKACELHNEWNKFAVLVDLKVLALWRGYSRVDLSSFKAVVNVCR